MKMIRVLQVVPSLNINSGMMSVVMNYYREIDRSKIQFDFLYFGEMAESHQKEIEALGGRTFYMKRPTFKPQDQRRLNAFFEKHKGEYIAVHCHPIWVSAVVAHAAKKSGIHHIIQHAHSTQYSEKKISAIRNRVLVKFISLFATDYIACNDEAARLLGTRRADKNQVFILPNAINLKKYEFDENSREKIRQEFGASQEMALLGSVGRLSVEKNQRFIVEIFKEYHEKNPQSMLILVGDGALRGQIENEISKLGLKDSVILTGKRTDVGAILSGLDVFIMPSVFEGTPVSAIEARASGLPCLLSDTITRSVDMKGMTYLSIKEPPLVWAQEAEKQMINNRDNNRYDYAEVISHGFDIKVEAIKLQEYYLGLR